MLLISTNMKAVVLYNVSKNLYEFFDKKKYYCITVYVIFKIRDSNKLKLLSFIKLYLRTFLLKMYFVIRAIF